MKVDAFDFELSEELIAQYPSKERAASRLLCLDRDSGAVQHKSFFELPELLNDGDLMVFNDTRVIPARLYGHKITGGKVELLVERVLSEQQLLAHVKASKAPKPGSELLLADKIKATVIEKREDLFLLQFHGQQKVLEVLEQFGHIPLPPYIDRNDEHSDKERYQTVYARNKGAVAAPTAGLHFDQALLDKIKAKGVATAFLTLHVGAGTFQPVRVADISNHVMHAEYFELSAAVCEQVAATKKRGGRVIAVGTTSVRALESAAPSGQLRPFQGETDIFIYPGFKFNCVDAIITNFHLPKSTLLMLVSAFAGRENILHAYQQAVAAKYRFFSYGDAMFIA